MDLLFIFVIAKLVGKTAKLTGKAETTVRAWFKMGRTVCTSILTKRGKMVDTKEKPIKINEAWFAGRW